MKRANLEPMTLFQRLPGRLWNGQTKDQSAAGRWRKLLQSIAPTTETTFQRLCLKPDIKELYAKVFEDIRTVKELGADVVENSRTARILLGGNSLNKQKRFAAIFILRHQRRCEDELSDYTRMVNHFTAVAYYLDGKTPKICIKVTLLSQVASA